MNVTYSTEYLLEEKTQQNVMVLHTNVEVIHVL